MKKYLLLTAAAATAIVAAGPAMAGSLSARAGVGAVNATPTIPYRLAAELNFGSGVAATQGQFDLIYDFNAPLTPGSYTVTIEYAGASITAPLPTTPVVGAAATAAGDRTGSGAGQGPLGFYVSSVGGAEANTLTVTAQTANQVTISLFIPVGNTVTSIFLNPAILVTGNVQITAATRNQVTGQAVDPSVISTLVTTNNRGFAAGFDRGIGAAAAATGLGNGAGTDTRIAEGAAPVFTTRNGDAQVGEAIVAVSGNSVFNSFAGVTTSQVVYKDLIGTAVSLADIVSKTITITGNLAGWTTTPASNSTPTASGAVIQVTGAGTANAALQGPGGDGATGVPNAGTVGTTQVQLAPTTAGAGAPQLNPTELPATIALQLGAAFTSPAATAGSFEDIQTDGFSYIVPWVATSNQAATTGNTTIIRVSNIATDYVTAGGRVYGQLYNPSNAANATPSRSALLGTLGNGRTGAREVIVTSADLQNAFGDFGRGDLRLTITTTDTTANTVPGGGAGALGSSNIVVKRILQNANGSQTEINVLPGDATSNANDPNTSAARY